MDLTQSCWPAGGTTEESWKGVVILGCWCRYVAVLYDKVETVMESSDDILSVSVIKDIIDWASTNPLMQKISDSSCVYLIGASLRHQTDKNLGSQDTRGEASCPC